MSSSSNMVSTSTAVPGRRATISRVASMPCRPGSCRSMMTTSGCSLADSSTAASPSAASPATAMPSAASSTACSPSRTIGWSSTNRTEIGRGPVTRHPGQAGASTPGPGRPRRPDRRSGCRRAPPRAPAWPASPRRPARARCPLPSSRTSTRSRPWLSISSHTWQVCASECRTALLTASTAIRNVATSTAAGRSASWPASSVIRTPASLTQPADVRGDCANESEVVQR